MSDSDVISSILAGLTFIGIAVALFLGIKSIRANRQLQESQYRRGILDEILKWTTQISHCSTRLGIGGFQEMHESLKNPESARIFEMVKASNMSDDYFRLRTEGSNFEILLRNGKNKDNTLVSKINELISVLDNAVTLYDNRAMEFVNLEKNESAFTFHDLAVVLDKSIKETGDLSRALSARIGDVRQAVFTLKHIG